MKIFDAGVANGRVPISLEVLDETASWCSEYESTLSGVVTEDLNSNILMM
jgi:hypothetical protein